MVKDFKYIIKRIIIGTGVALVLSFLRGNLFIMTYALTSHTDSIELCATNLGCNTQASSPVTQSYANSGLVNFTNVSLQQNHTYSMNFYMTMTTPSFSFSSGYPQMYVRQGNGTSFRAYPDRNENLFVNRTGTNTYSVTWSFDLDNTGGSFNIAYVQFNFTSNYNSSLYSTTINSVTLDYTDITGGSGSSNDDIINNATSNTQNIINNANNNSQNVINNNNNNTTNIINNQNENSNNEIASQNVCRVISNNTLKNVGYLGNNGVFSSQTSGTNRSSDFIAINSQASFKLYKQSLGSNYNYRYCFYKSDKTYISCGFNQSLTEGNNITIPSNARFLRFTINLNGGPTYEICSNGNQAINDSLNDLNNNLTDDSGIEDSEMSNFFDDFDIDESNSPVSDFLTMPITLMTAYVNGMSSTCSPVSLGSLYGTTLTLPCINLQTYFGANLWSLIDALFCFYMVYNIGMLCVSIYESITSLSDGFQLLYEPQHTGHSRVSRNEGLY